MENNDRFKGIPLCKGAPELGNACGRCARCHAPAKFQSGNEAFEAVCRNDMNIAQALAMLDPTRAYNFKHAAWIGWLAHESVTVNGLPRGLLERLVRLDNSFGEHREATRDLVAFLAVSEVPARPIRFADLPQPAEDYAVAYWADEFGCTIKADHKDRNVKSGGAPALVAERYTTPLYLVHPSVELLRDALDHIARTCHQSRQSTRRIRWIEARANGALEGKPYDASLIELPVKVDRAIDRLKRQKETLLKRVLQLEALLREGQAFTNDVAHDADVWLKIEEALDKFPARCTDCLGSGHAHVNSMPVAGTCETCRGKGLLVAEE